MERLIDDGTFDALRRGEPITLRSPARANFSVGDFVLFSISDEEVLPARVIRVESGIVCAGESYVRLTIQRDETPDDASA